MGESIWIWAVLAAAAAAVAGLYVFRRGYPGKGEGAALDLSLARRVTARFPALSRQEADPAPPGPARADAGLQGNLAQTPVHDLLQFLALGRKSGILEIASGRRTGRVVVQEGRICKDSYRGKDGIDALFMLLDLSEGDFEFYEQPLQEPVSQPGIEVVDAIMLWMERKSRKKA